MRQEIIDSINNMDRDALVDVGYTFNIVDSKQLADYFDDLLKNSFFKKLKRQIKQRALADENIAEYVLLF
ncbi:hypothetical protein CMI37_21990 [Candidatus Pacearchaeota archaeon]|nr:hypothetical protein [Candidatus Pacearchaeota archaeon]|tara:strand:+ start:2921 stop:3130 length:210 start_codon:yes stop_codon:yes gene_type:complete